MSANKNLDRYFDLLKIPKNASIGYIESAHRRSMIEPTEDDEYNQMVETAFQKIFAQKKPQPASEPTKSFYSTNRNTENPTLTGENSFKGDDFFELNEAENGFTKVSKVCQNVNQQNEQREKTPQRTQSQCNPINDISIHTDELSNAFNKKLSFGTEPTSSGISRTSSIRNNNSVNNDILKKTSGDESQFNTTENDKPSKDFKPERNEANKQSESENVKSKDEEKPQEAAKRPEFRKKSALHPRQLKKPDKNPAIEQEILLTTEEIQRGCTKEVKVGRKMEIIGKKWVDDKTFSVVINPGVAIDTRITFEQEGHRNMKALPGDVVFIIKDKLNVTFKKEKPEKELAGQNASSNSQQGNKQMSEDTKQNSKLENAMITKHDLWISLDEVLKGCKKKIQIKRKRFDNDQINFEDKTVEISIKPGIETGAQIKLSQEGDQLPDGSFADAIFIVREVKHPQLVRQGTDIKYVAKVSQKQLDDQVEIIIPALEKEIATVKLDESVAKYMNKCLYSKGLPYPVNTRMRGNINVEFEIVSDNEAKEIVLKAQDEPKTKPKKAIDNENNIKETKENFSNKLSPNVLELKLTLEEMFRGCVKREEITRIIIDGAGKQKIENVLLKVNTKPGSITGTQIKVDNEGNREYPKIPADVIFTVIEEPHSIFERDGHDIVYTAKVTSQEAILGCKLNIPTLEGIPAHFQTEGGITPETVRLVTNYGLPYLDEPTKRGDIKIKFDIIFEQEKRQDPPVVHELFLTLEQILQGTIKRLKINRQVTNARNYEKQEDKEVTIDVKPGTLSGTQFTFPREGDQKPGQIPADVVFIVRDAQHEIFKRNGADIEFIAEITQNQLVNGGKLEIPTLENTKKSIHIDGIIVGKTVKRISGQGLPNLENPSKRGDILVHFKLSKTKDPDIEHDLPLTLENILNGCTKRIKINHKILDQKGNENFKDEIVVIEVRPGTIEGTEFRFPNLGDENPDSLPADIVFTARDKPHANFERNGADIVHKVMITKSEIEQEIEFEIPTLEGEPKLLKLQKFTKTEDNKNYPGEGLPIDCDSEKRGNFIVQFEIVKEDRKSPEVEHKLSISLMHVLYGNSQEMKINRTVIDLNRNEKIEEQIVTIKIKPGTETGKRLNFARRGDIRPGYIPGDVVFVVVDEPHEIFKRNGAHLELKAPIKVLSDQVDSREFQNIPTLENSNKTLKMIKITKDSLGKVEGCGLPYSFEPKERGDILVRFEVIPNNSGPITNSQTTKDKKSNKPNNRDLMDTAEGVDNSQNKLESSVIQSQILDDPIYENVELSLKEIMVGGSKNVWFKRQTINQDGSKSFDHKKFTIEFKPGVLSGEKFVFEKAGHRNFEKIPVDVVFIIKDAPHRYFKRNGADVEFTSKISNFESKRTFQRRIPKLDDDYYNLTVDNLDSKNTAIIEGYGLPYYEKPEKRGNIVVNFEIIGKEKDNYKIQNSNLLQMSPIEKKLLVSLESILNGHIEKYQWRYTIFDPNGGTRDENKMLDIVIKPGTKTGERIVFPKHGNQHNGAIPADLVFIIEDKPHDKFKRNGVNIEYIAKISAVQAAKGNCRISIPTLEIASFPIDIQKPINSESIIQINGHGLPFPDDNTKRGDLHVRFEITDTDEGNSKNVIINEHANKSKDFSNAKSKPAETLKELPAKEYDLFVTLEEILHGRVKKQQIERDVVDSEGNKKKEFKILTAEIRPGTEAGTKFYFPGEGDRIYGKEPGDIVFVVRDAPQTLFVRKGVDILFTAKINTFQSQNGFQIKVPTLEKGYEVISSKEKIGFGSYISLEGRGLPYPDNQNKRGDIKILFDITHSGATLV